MRKLSSVLLAALISTATYSAYAAEVTGAGATFPAPIYSKWADSYQKATGNKINYQSIGSSGGIKQIIAKTVDFGASDMPLKPEALQQDGLVQFPTVIGGVVPVFNLPGINVPVMPEGGLRMTGKLLGDIFLGKVTKWNDPQLVALNPSLKLPDQDISVIRRADGSGTTFLFTNYLSKVNPDWKAAIGEGTAVQWPTGMGGKGNEGVAAFVQRLPGSIGYVEYAYAKQNKMTFVRLQNKEGTFVTPSEDSFRAAAERADWNRAAFYEILTDQSAKNAWPITGATFIVMQKKPEKLEQAAEVLKFFEWAYKDGGAEAEKMDYVSLPDATVKLIKESWSNIQDGTGKPVYKAAK